MKTLTMGLTNVFVFRYSGNLSTPVMEKIQRSFDNLFHEGHSCIVLNMEQVNNLSLTGIGILMEQVRKSQDLNGDIRIACMSPKLKSAFQRVGALKAIREYSTEHEAIESFLPMGG